MARLSEFQRGGVGVPRLAGRPAGWRGLVVLAALVLATAASCTDDGPSSGGGGDSSAPLDGDEAATALGPTQEATGTPVRIGFVNLEGGPALSLPGLRQSAEAAVAYANEHLGGVEGHPIELVTCNDLGDGASLVACSNQLVESNVAAVVQGRLSTEDTVVKTVTDAGIPWIGDMQTAGSLSLENVFSVNNTNLALYGRTAQVARDEGYQHALYLSLDIPVLHDQVERIFRPLYESFDAQLDFVAIPPAAADPTPQVAAGLREAPDQIFVAGQPSFCEAVLPAVQTASVEQVPLFATASCVDDQVLNDLGDVLDGASTYVLAAPGSTGEEAVLYQAVMEKYSPDSDRYALNPAGYGNVLSLVRAVNGVGLDGEPTADAIAEALKSARDVPVPLFDGATFTCDGTVVPKFPAVCAANMLAATVEDGELTDVEVVDGSAIFNE